MKVLLVTFQGDMAGSTNSISYLAKGLAGRGHEVYVGCRKESLLYSMLEGTGVQLLPMVFNKKYGFDNAREIADAVQKYGIQVVNAQSSRDRYSSIFARVLHKAKCKVVHTRRQISASDGGKIQGWFYTTFTDKVVAVSKGVKESLMKLGIKDNHIAVIYNGTPDEKYDVIDEQIIKDLKAKHNIFDSDVVIGSVSRPKKQDQIIRSLVNLDKSVKLLLVGPNEDEQKQYTDLIKELNLEDRVIFSGAVDQTMSLNYYKLLDVKVLASTMEGLSQALLESMYLGVPVVATNAAGNPDLIEEGKNGLLFEDNDIDGLTQKIKMILDSEELKNKLIEEGEKTAKGFFSINRVIDDYEKLFSELIAN